VATNLPKLPDLLETLPKYSLVLTGGELKNIIIMGFASSRIGFGT
jgi:hypothetical protein